MRAPRLVLLAAAVLPLAACRTPGKADHDGGHGGGSKAMTGLKTAVIDFDPAGRPPVPVEVELAVTELEHERGLMFRRHLEEGHGMLFIFKTDDDRTFWMKNTLIPLDMIFIGHDHRVVGIVADASPLTTTARDVGKPCRYVVEVPGGWAQANHIVAGTLVRFENVPGGD